MSRQDISEARIAVDDAIDLLNQVPKNYGGHLEANGSSTCDAPPEHYRHDDGRIMRLVRVLDDDAVIASYRGRHIVLPPWKLSAV